MSLILYVDDEETIARVVERYFARRGDEVLLAHTLTDARAILRSHSPDAIFLDLAIGNESGFELMAWIHEEQPAIADRVSFVTGDVTNTSDHRHLWEMLGHRFIRKPFQLSALAAITDGARSRATA